MAKNLQFSTTATIASSGTTSDTQTMDSNRIPLAIVIPSAFTGTAVTFKASADNATFQPLYYEGTQYSVNVGTSRFIALDRRAFESVKYVQIVSGSTETASRSITVISGE